MQCNEMLNLKWTADIKNYSFITNYKLKKVIQTCHAEKRFIKKCKQFQRMLNEYNLGNF